MIVANRKVLASGWTDDHTALQEQIHKQLRPKHLVHSDIVTASVLGAVKQYYAGNFEVIEQVPVQQQSGDFLEAAWDALRTVPAGTTISYSELAERAGSPDAVQPAASACEHNATLLFIPCHRAVKSSGETGAFRYGTDLKERLLDRETKAKVSANA